MAYRYNPFSKPLAEFPPEELNVLRDVSEGWFVDYKSEPLSPRDFGKHLSAFANQFGGWLFVGVKEGPNKSLKAGSFPGIPSSEVGSALVRIREGVCAHVSPTVYFDHRVIDGPVEEVGLVAGRSIIVVSVPEAPNPPFVHSSGRIYRRIADSSDPKPELDRAVLDAMWRKSEEPRIRLREFVLKPAEHPRTDNTFCHVYFMEDFTFSLPEYNLDLQIFRHAMRMERPELPSISLDNLYPTQDGFIGRHLFRNDPAADLIALRWWHTGNVRLTIPINDVQPSSYQDELLGSFIEAMGPKWSQYGRILNLDQWAFVILTLTMRYLDLRDKLQSEENIYGKIVFSNCLSATPFIGMESYLKTVKQYGIPVVQDSVTMFPAGTELSTFTGLTDGREQDLFQRSCSFIVPLAVNGLKALSVVLDLEKSVEFGQEFAHAMRRGLDEGQSQSSKRL